MQIYGLIIKPFSNVYILAYIQDFASTRRALGD